MLNFLKKNKNLAVRILFVPNILLCFLFLVQKSIFILKFCIVFDKKRIEDLNLVYFIQFGAKSYFKIFTQSQNTKVYEYFPGSLYIDIGCINATHI